MNADPQLRERLERASEYVTVQPDRRLEGIRDAAERRRRGRRTRALAVAAVIATAVVVILSQLRLGDDSEISVGAPPTGRIGYLGIQGSHRGLFALDTATGDVESLTSEDESVLWADWSPDGSRVAYILEEPGPRFAIVVADADGSDPTRIFDEGDTGAAGPDVIDVAWSPDGSRIAFSGRTVEGGTARRTILIVNADGSGEPVVLDGHWESVSWSPDGGRLLLLGFPEEEVFDLYTAHPDGSELVQLTDDEAVEHESSWSPDGARIVFATGENDLSQDVYVMNEDGSDVRRLTDWEGLDLFPVWSPDGRWIAFASDRDATLAQQASNRSGDEIFIGLSLYVMLADGSDVGTLLERDVVLPVSWTP
jgi:TolB protein